jgi:16S rRNA (guanine(1405)-N(7))-methyltransferase
MRLEQGAEYIAVDVDADVVGFVAACLELMGLRARARVADIVSNPPRDVVQLALVLKMIPCLEQQQDEAGTLLLRALRARAVAVSFPVRSLGGRAKGMRENYSRLFEEMARREGWTIEAIPVSGELLFLTRAAATPQ